MAKRQTRWVDRIDMADTILSGDDKVDLLEDMSNDVRKGCTVTRMIGQINFVPIANPMNAKHLLMGICLVTDNAFALTNALPRPENQAEQPGWLWRGYVTCVSEQIGVLGEFSQISFDIRTQRRLMGEGMTLAFVINNDSVDACTMDLFVRTLCLMP